MIRKVAISAGQWGAKVEANSLGNILSEPHFVIMKIEQRSYSSPGYDRDEPGYDTEYEDVTYRSFVDQGEWEKAINDIYSERVAGRQEKNVQHVFFHSGGRIEPKFSVSVKVSLGKKL